MALATTSSIWRSTGGDTTRTAVSGSMSMHAPFFISNVATTGANVVVSSVANAPTLILPANAIVTSVTISNPSTGGNSAINIGFTPLINVGPGQNTTLGTNVPAAYVNGGNVAARTQFSITSATAGSSLSNVANATYDVVLTAAIGAAGAAGGNVTGYISYYVFDPLYGQQNV